MKQWNKQLVLINKNLFLINSIKITALSYQNHCLVPNSSIKVVFNRQVLFLNNKKFSKIKNHIQWQKLKKDFIKNYIEKSIFDEIITAYEKKGYKIPNLLKKTIFDVSPMLVDLHKIKEFPILYSFKLISKWR